MFGIFTRKQDYNSTCRRVNAGLHLSIPDLEEWSIKSVANTKESYINFEIDNAIVTACYPYTDDDDEELIELVKEKILFIDKPARFWVNSLGNNEELRVRDGTNGRIGFGISDTSDDLLIKIYLTTEEVNSILFIMNTNYKEKELQAIDALNEFSDQYRDTEKEKFVLTPSGKKNIMLSIFWLLPFNLNIDNIESARFNTFHIDSIDF